MSSGGYKVFTNDGQFIGAYNNEKLALEVERVGRPLIGEEFDNLFGVNQIEYAESERINAQAKTLEG